MLLQCEVNLRKEMHRARVVVEGSRVLRQQPRRKAWSALLLPVGLSLRTPTMLSTSASPRAVSVQMQGDSDVLEALRRENAKFTSELQSLENMQGYSAPTNPGYYNQNQAPDLSTRAVRVAGPLALAAGAVAATLAVSSATAPAPITKEEIYAAQKEWGNAIVRISKTYLDGGDYVSAAAAAADQLYGYGRTDVLFKPTKASVEPFRPTAEGAMSYFIGGSKNKDFDEDHGFALGPDGMGWKKVIFDNNKIDFNGATAQAMGEYYFYSAKDNSVAKVEYTFGYKRNDDGKMRIYLHHSSLPYKPPAPKA